MKRRILCVLLALALCLGLAACGGSAKKWQEAYDLGVKYLAEGNYEEAVIQFAAAIEIDPKRAEAYVGRGDAYAAAQNPAAAAEDYRQAVNLGGADADTYRKLAEALQQQGDTAGACAVLQQGVDATGDPGLAALLEQMQKPEPGSDAYYQALSKKLPADLFDLNMAVNGVSIAEADIYTIAGWYGESVQEDTYGYLLFKRAKYSNAIQNHGASVVAGYWPLYNDHDRTDQVPSVWPEDRYLGGVKPYDTLAAALEKWGFTPEEIDYLQHCVRLTFEQETAADGTVRWELTGQTAEQDHNATPGRCEVRIWDVMHQPLHYRLCFDMPDRSTQNPSPVDGSAVLQSVQITNNADAAKEVK